MFKAYLNENLSYFFLNFYKILNMFAGSDKKMYVANSLTKFDGPIVICPEGHINNTNGCSK